MRLLSTLVADVLKGGMQTHTTPSPSAPPLLVRGGKGFNSPLLFKEGWHATHDGVVSGRWLDAVWRRFSPSFSAANEWDRTVESRF
jgi:hypothetical protein